MNIGETTVNLLLMQGGSPGAMRACELNIDTVYFMWNYYQI